MWNLIKYEWRRIWGGKLTKLSVLGCGLCILFFVFSSISQLSVIDQNGNGYSGVKAAGILKDSREKQLLSQTRIEDIMAEYLAYTKNSGTNSQVEKYQFLSEKMYRTYYLPNRDLFTLIATNYESFGDNRSLKETYEENIGKDFYKARSERTEQWLNIKVNQQLLTEKEKEYWLEKDSKVGIYEYGNFKGWRSILDSTSWLVLIMIVICIGIAPVFAGEYQTKTDSLLLSMRYGKNKLIKAKIITSILYTSILYWGITIGYSLIYFMVLGTQGGGLPIQLYDNSYPISYPMMMNQAVILFIIVGYLATLCIMSVTLFMSAVFKNPYAVIIAAFLFIIIPSFLYFNMGGYLWQHLLALIPSKIIEFKFNDYITYSFENFMLNRPMMMSILYLIVIPILLSIANHKFKTHEVNS